MTSKTFLEKRVSIELITMTLELCMRLLFKKIKSHTCLEIFQCTKNTNRREHGVLFHCVSEAKSSEEERKLIQNGTLKSTSAVKK